MGGHGVSPGWVGGLQSSLQTALTHAGFTGFVPRAQFLIGTGYPITTNWALLELSQMTLGSRTEKDGGVLSPLGKIYPTDRGLLPRYTG